MPDTMIRQPPDRPAGRTCLFNAILVDPASGLQEPGGLVMENGLLTDCGPHLTLNAPADADVVIDCHKHVVCPGLVDMWVFAGEPGFAHREDLASVSRAAAAGGVTTIICTPKTDPVIDDMALVDYIERRAAATSLVHIHPMAALTKGLKGAEMTEIGLLKQAGAVAFSDGSQSVMNARVMQRIMSYARDFDALIVHFTEDADLADGSVMNEGLQSARLGLPGIPEIAETIMLERDLRLVEATGTRYHAAQISCKAAIDIVRQARQSGLSFTCGTSINHLVLNETDIGSYRTFFKLKPPLRPEHDRAALVEAVRQGEIDVIVSAHNPKDADVKRRPFEEAEAGAIGIETLLPALLKLHHNDGIALPDLLRPVTVNPADLLGLNTGRLEPGRPADVIVLDVDTPWIVAIDDLRSKSKNTTFERSDMQGRVLRTFVAGQPVFPDTPASDDQQTSARLVEA